MHNLRLQNLKFKYLIDDIDIDIWYFGNFASMEDIRRKCNLMMNLSKFIFNKKILSRVQVCNQILPNNNRFIYLF